jgi:hypothetical protein
MGDGMTEYAQREIARRNTQAKFPVLIKIEHEELGDFYYANSDQDIIYDGNTYYASVFSLEPPDKDGDKVGNARITISAIDQIWIQRIRSTQKPARLYFIAAILYDKNGNIQVEKLEENSFILRSASWNEIAISWEMVFDENMTILLPAEDCTVLTCPGCA